ncbi:acyl-CoA dehydrogenase [Paeniglutamicibacter antarcticus]|uniref:Acyl-CoA dehydrogenase n=1 Tax=Paeniglutamicibacter antarcticus TaxID=494023 RepID=A0ABP9TIA0_9MICC
MSLGWDLIDSLVEAAQECHGEPSPLLELLRTSAQDPPIPGRGQTLGLWELLATLGSIDLVAARAVEPHLDAAAILAQAGIRWTPGTSWGVFAAEGQRKLAATAPAEPSASWNLAGEKPWCSLAGTLDHAVVTAHVPGGRRAFSVDLKQPGVSPHAGTWTSHGLHRIPSEAVSFDQVPATPVGATDWYLDRPGFAVGGVAVAACWFGGAVGIFRTLFAAAQAREPDQLALAWLGEADRLLAAGATALHVAAQSADAGTLDWVTAQRVRGLVAGICERLITLAGQSLGPAPLGFDHSHAQRIADLGIYLRQHHAARDDAALGTLLLEASGSTDKGIGPW